MARIPAGADPVAPASTGGARVAVIETDPAALERCETHIIASLQTFSMKSTDEGREATDRAIDGYVDVMRAAFFTPERVVIAIKRAIRCAGAVPEPYGPERQEHDVWDLMTEQFVTRAIRRYFQIPPTATP